KCYFGCSILCLSAIVNAANRTYFGQMKVTLLYYNFDYSRSPVLRTFYILNNQDTTYLCSHVVTLNPNSVLRRTRA
ncbi:hypothetical protein L9F63_010771, partial [Diploptera punctata]